MLNVDPLSDRASKKGYVKESRVWSGHTSQLTNTGWILLAVFFYWLLVPVGIAVWKFIELYCHRYILTTDRLIEKNGVLNRSTDQLELSRVQDVRQRETLLQRLFGKGDVIVVTTDKTHPQVTLRWVGRSSQLADAVRKHAKEAKLRDPYAEINVN